MYDAHWWIGVIATVDDFFYVPSWPNSIQFNWPKREDRCFVPFKQVLCRISAPCSVTGQQYNLMDKDAKLIHESLSNLKEGY